MTLSHDVSVEHKGGSMAELKVLKWRDEKTGWGLYEVWEKYESVAVHFNDLLIRLRLQALAGVAALSTLVGIFAKTDMGLVQGSWEIAGTAFVALAAFWVAIWVLDLAYYNRLLLGAVSAIMDLENLSTTGEKRVTSIVLSTRIAASVDRTMATRLTRWGRFYLLRGVYFFYSVVFVALVAGAFYCFWKHAHFVPPTPRSIVVPI